MVDSFLIEQQTIMRLMAENSPHPIVKPWHLAHSLSRCANAIRSLRNGSMTMAESVREYCEIATVTTDADLTLWHERYRLRRSQITAAINDRIRDWYSRGWVALDNGVIEITPVGMKNVTQEMEMHGLEMKR